MWKCWGLMKFLIETELSRKWSENKEKILVLSNIYRNFEKN